MENASLTAIAGITTGHVTDEFNLTGVTVVRFAGDGARAAISVQGAAPGTRETDLLEPGNLVERVHAIVLTGGSAYGLDAASGVMAALEEEGIGLPAFEDTVVPIVPAAVLFDLSVGSSTVRPDTTWGYKAAKEATDSPIPSGNVGAGMGATVGKLLGPSQAMKGGLGSALVHLDSGVIVSALVAVNAVGEVVDSASNTVIAGIRANDVGRYESAVDLALGDAAIESVAATNTTLGLVGTNANLNKTQLKKVSEMAHDGMARAIRPIHTQFDGDTVFAVSMPGSEVEMTVNADAQLNSIGIAAAKVLELAIVDAVRSAKSVGGIVASCDWQND
ncbi:MAG: P1 family peptidase [Pseudomonadota bacterium]|nr:P1 family peptidase [Pseudomonadota bacterium]